MPALTYTSSGIPGPLTRSSSAIVGAAKLPPDVLVYATTCSVFWGSAVGKAWNEPTVGSGSSFCCLIGFYDFPLSAEKFVVDSWPIGLCVVILATKGLESKEYNWGK